MGIDMLLSWVYPIVYLSIAICSFTFIRHQIGVLLGIAFSLSLVTSLTWRVVSLLGMRDFDGLTPMYMILKIINPILFIGFAVLTIIAIVKIGEVVNAGAHSNRNNGSGQRAGHDNASLGENDLDGC